MGLKSLSEATTEGRMKEAAQKGWQAADKPCAYPHALQPLCCSYLQLISMFKSVT
jgi:hypothetical protein